MGIICDVKYQMIATDLYYQNICKGIVHSLKLTAIQKYFLCCNFSPFFEDRFYFDDGKYLI